MNYTRGNMNKVQINGSLVFINRDIRYQTIFGFGATITDAAAINIQSVSLPAQDNLIQ